MAPYHRRNPTIRLPQSLREQIEAQESGTAGRRSAKHALSRRESRKGQRQAKKERKAEHFSQPHYQAPKQGVKRPAESSDDEPVPKKRKLSQRAVPSPTPSKPTTSPAAVRQKPELSSSKGPTALAKLSARLDGEPLPLPTKHSKPKPTTAVPPPRTRAEMEEDARIARLERLLGGAGRKGVSAEEDDGFDDLLDFVDTIVPPSTAKSKGVAGPRVPPGDTDEDDEEESMDEDEDVDEEEESQAESDAEEEQGDGDLGQSGDDESEDEEREDGPDEGDGDHLSVGEDEETSAFSPVNGLDSSKTAGSAYVPPHLRARRTEGATDTSPHGSGANPSAELVKLKRQSQGLLNRLTEQNIGSILSEIEALYRNNRRNDVTTTLTDLILDTISSRSNLLDSFVILYAALIASLTRVMGTEFGAYFVHSLVTSYSKYYEMLQPADATEDAIAERGKECLNLVVLLSELYNFQVVACMLIYDIVRELLAGPLTEFNVELLLKLLKSSGSQLRQDDPSALNDIVGLVQSKVAEEDNRSLGSRTRFMVETLTNLKNNKSKAVQNQAVASEATNRMKKFISGLGRTHQVRAHDPLRVSLADLVSSDQKGKWWLVGSAWGGDPLVDRQAQSPTEDTSVPPENALLKLARKQGMNTAVRRNIFVVLMGSEDYVDAQERLDQLNLTEVQQREIIRVLLHCCGTEKKYNPFYALVAQRLCQASHSHKVTLQFCLWDFLRELGETDVGGAEILKAARDESVLAFDTSTTSSRVTNLAKAYAWLIAKGASSLTIFRPVNFTSLQPRTVIFFQTFFVYLFASTQSLAPVIDISKQSQIAKNRDRTALEQVVMKAASNAGLAKGIVHFISHLLVDGQEYSAPVAELIGWGCDVSKETLLTAMDFAATLG